MLNQHVALDDVQIQWWIQMYLFRDIAFTFIKWLWGKHAFSEAKPAEKGTQRLALI